MTTLMIVYIVLIFLGLVLSLFGKHYLLPWIIVGIIMTIALGFLMFIGLGLGGGSHNDSQTVLLTIAYSWMCYSVGLILSSFIRKRFTSGKWKNSAILFLFFFVLYPLLTTNLHIFSVKYPSSSSVYKPGQPPSEIDCSVSNISPLGFVFDPSRISLTAVVYDENNNKIYEKDLEQTLPFKYTQNQVHFIGFGVLSCKIWAIEPFSVEEYIQKIVQKYSSYDEFIKHKLYFKYFYNWKGDIKESDKYYIEPINHDSVAASEKLLDKNWQLVRLFRHFTFWMPKDFNVVLAGRIEVHNKGPYEELLMIFEGERFAKTKEDALKEFEEIPGEFEKKVEIGKSKIEADRYVKYSKLGRSNTGEGRRENQVDYVFNFGNYWYHVAYYASGYVTGEVFEEVLSTLEKTNNL